jgi:pimeloyl-ACP methyl ester carboxylesterase
MLWLIVGGYLVAALLVFWQQRRFIYFPPALPAHEVERLAKEDLLDPWTNPAGESIGWKRLSPTQPSHGKVMILHGNAGAAIFCGHYADLIQQAATLDVFMLEYPGYVGRPGSPSEQSLYAAAEEAFTLLGTDSPVYLVGESLGTGVAAYLAGRHPEAVTGVMLLAPYNSLVAVGQGQMPIFPVGLMLKDRFPAEKHLRQFHGPVAMLAVTDDRVVPARFGRALHDRYAGPKRLWEVPRGDHEAIWQQTAEWWQEAFGFIRSNLVSHRPP